MPSFPQGLQTLQTDISFACCYVNLHMTWMKSIRSVYSTGRWGTAITRTLFRSA